MSLQRIEIRTPEGTRLMLEGECNLISGDDFDAHGGYGALNTMRTPEKMIIDDFKIYVLDGDLGDAVEITDKLLKNVLTSFKELFFDKMNDSLIF